MDNLGREDREVVELWIDDLLERLRQGFLNLAQIINVALQNIEAEMQELTFIPIKVVLESGIILKNNNNSSSNLCRNWIDFAENVLTIKWLVRRISRCMWFHKFHKFL